MKSEINPNFRRMYRRLSPKVKRRVQRAYKQWKKNPSTPGLHFKRVDDEEQIFSVRIGLDYRAVGALEGDLITWFWIGKHTEYERLLKRGQRGL